MATVGDIVAYYPTGHVGADFQPAMLLEIDKPGMVASLKVFQLGDDVYL